MELSDTKVHAVLQHYLSLHEADAVVGMLYDTEYTSDDIIEYIDWCHKRYEFGEDTEFNSWLDDRKPRVHIEILVTECGTPIHEELDFPKLGEDMDHGTEVWMPQGMSADVLAVAGGHARNTIENLMLIFGYTYFQKLKHKTSTIYYYKKIMA